MDVGLEDGDLPAFCRFIQGEDETIQRLRLRMLQHRGDWILDRSAGLPYLDWGQLRSPPLEQIRAAIQVEIETCPGVERVERIDVAFVQPRQEVTVQATARLTSGQRASVLLRRSGDALNSMPWTTTEVGLF